MPSTIKRHLFLPYAREFHLADGRRLGVVHAEPPQDWRLIHDAIERDPSRLLWGRSKIKQRDDSLIGNIHAVVVGHTIVDAPLWLGNVAYLDTGAFTRTGTLTLVEVSELLDLAPLSVRRGWRTP